MEGSLSKWTNVMKGWQYRFFVLDDSAGLLSYYTSRDKMLKGVRRGCVRLTGAIIGIDDQDSTTFTITVDGKTFHFQARNNEEREKWIRCLEDTIIRHKYGCHSSGSSVSTVEYIKALPTLHDFDKKVSEADAYLQILIDQVNVLEENKSTLPDETDIEACEQIIKTTNEMLEEVKHTIVLLQIAKSSAFPVNGTYQPRLQRDSSYSLPNDDSKDGSMDLESEVDEKSELPVYRLASSSRYLPDVPSVSYSSSDDEDFYDACDSNLDFSSRHNSTSDNSPIDYRRHILSETSLPGTPKRSSSVSTNDTAPSGNEEESSRRESEVFNVAKPSTSSPFVPDDNMIDFDDLYEDPSEIELESQPSVIKHLISQVKIGMDLTKVVLPTFILERRSLLEMYSDYFAHPDIFLKAVDLPTAKDRIVQIVKWYLSSYHAGRKSTIAKKPYNPILGEVFRCWWDLDDANTNNEKRSFDDTRSMGNNIPADEEADDLTKDGPVPWCTNDQLVFIAEQVSHHPPISAFYVEHVKKKVSLNAHLWTKSKFLGLSVGVHNIGYASVHLLEHNEEYICTFPNGYGRSILTVPWIELGGSTTIKCQSTGYYCNIEFLTKPFYGGKKHRISAEVFTPGDKKPFLTINGEWNGVMEAKWTDGPTELFLDTRKLNVNKKKVKKIADQESNESREIWKYVTLGLKYNDVDQATNAKMQIEQKQRDEAQIRKENNEKWEPKFFYEQDGIWLYRNPLEKRLNITFDRRYSIP